MNLFGVILRAQDNRPATPKKGKRETQEDPKTIQTESNGAANNDPIWCIKIYVYSLAFPILICIKLTREGSRRRRQPKSLRITGKLLFNLMSH